MPRPDAAPSVAAALASPAVQLFMERAAASGYQAALGDGEAAIVAGICRRLDGIALAIEIAASRVGTFGIRGTADLLDGGAGLLLQGRRSALPRHQSLQALLDWSFNLLPPYEQTILRRLSIFVGQFTLEAAHAVAGEAEGQTQAITNAIASLVDKSLIQISSANGAAYYRLLDTTRAYAAAQLAESGEPEAIAKRHARYFAALLKASEAEESGFQARNIATTCRKWAISAMRWSGASRDPATSRSASSSRRARRCCSWRFRCSPNASGGACGRWTRWRTGIAGRAGSWSCRRLWRCRLCIPGAMAKGS